VTLADGGFVIGRRRQKHHVTGCRCPNCNHMRFKVSNGAACSKLTDEELEAGPHTSSPPRPHTRRPLPGVAHVVPSLTASFSLAPHSFQWQLSLSNFEVFWRDDVKV
jgi:hypothetical protein